jgi:hypothetical protein
MLENAKGKARKQTAKIPDGTGFPADGASGSTAERDAYAAPMQSSTREHEIALAAYYKAQQRGFQGGNPLEDWLAAEREFDGEYLARTMGQQEDEP